MALFSFRKGFRWSLYICKHDKELENVLHTNNLYATLVHLTNRYKNSEPTKPWTLWLNLNRKHANDGRDHAFQILPHHFASGKETQEFYQDLGSIDPSWRDHQAGNATEVLRDKDGKEIPIWQDFIEDPTKMIQQLEKSFKGIAPPEEETLQEIMDRIFP